MIPKVLKVLTESFSGIYNRRYYRAEDNPVKVGNPCNFTIFDKKVTIKNHPSGGVTLCLDGEELVGIWGYTLKPKNEIIVNTKCEQKMVIPLTDIDESQEVKTITIRGVEYVPVR